MLRISVGCTAAAVVLAVQPFVAIAAPQASPPAVVIDSQLTGSNLPAYTIALTYDDGPDSHTVSVDSQTVELAEYLHGQGIKATFFVNGCRIEGSPTTPNLGASNCLSQGARYPASTLQKLIDLGHRVANHTEDHFDLRGLTAKDAVAQLSIFEFGNGSSPALDQCIRDGYYLFRAPGNAWNSTVAAAIRADHRLDKIVGPFAYTVDSKDYDCFKANLSPSTCADWVMNGPPDGGGGRLPGINTSPSHSGIIQMHDRPEFNVGSDKPIELAKALIDPHPPLLPLLPRPTYTFVPLDAIPGVTGTRTFGSPGNPGGIPTLWTTNFRDDEGWANSESYYGSIRFADVNGDGKADVCARDAMGIKCALSTGLTFSAATYWLSGWFADSGIAPSGGWLPLQYGTTIQMGDLNGDGKADICGRRAEGLWCALSIASGFGTPSLWSATFSDAGGWGAGAAFYGSIRLADVNGDRKADACGRTSNGIVCALSNGAAFAAATAWLSSEFTDAGGWSAPEYGSTIQFGDVNNDGRADVCGRGFNRVACALSTGSSFSSATDWTPQNGIFSDFDGWALYPSRYKTVCLADIDGDQRADLCGRNATGLVCALSNGTSFVDYRYVQTGDYREEQAWLSPEYGSTVRFADLTGDGRADACGRGYSGLLCTTARPTALRFYSVSPCRLVDTRFAPDQPSLSAGIERQFSGIGRCFIPATAVSLAANITTVVGTAPGSLTIYDAGRRPRPAAAQTSFPPNAIRGTQALIPLGYSGKFAVFPNMASGTVNVLVDVSGYFAP
jgi:peptidoglycan/xylan/chitin deacetylase (PgdA/CDA1 family)